MYQKLIVSMLSIFIAFGLAACGSNQADKSQNINTKENSTNNKMDMNNATTDENMQMNHSSSGEIPNGLKIAENPKYNLGSKVIMQSNHMEGMKGAEATIVGAYDTTVYAVSYTPTNGGEEVKNHKWVIQEEIKGADDKTLEPGTEVILQAEHMPGMKGAKAKIDTDEKTTVYMVDYKPTTGGEIVKNHKWVTENELTTAK
ncbi:YdhK family protein [Rummeliibacillus stabekisii]|uniref:YdhK family protein n=1 Tax=Rummeliibacillus stabekisii TaxID=241244 RepID=UPI003723C945